MLLAVFFKCCAARLLGQGDEMFQKSHLLEQCVRWLLESFLENTVFVGQSFPVRPQAPAWDGMTGGSAGPHFTWHSGLAPVQPQLFPHLLLFGSAPLAKITWLGPMLFSPASGGTRFSGNFAVIFDCDNIASIAHRRASIAHRVSDDSGETVPRLRLRFAQLEGTGEHQSTHRAVVPASELPHLPFGAFPSHRSAPTQPPHLRAASWGHRFLKG